jgi:hypothetical protein
MVDHFFHVYTSLNFSVRIKIVLRMTVGHQPSSASK